MSNIKLFEDKKIRTHWDEKQEKWFFSIVDMLTIFGIKRSTDVAD